MKYKKKYLTVKELFNFYGHRKIMVEFKIIPNDLTENDIVDVCRLLADNMVIDLTEDNAFISWFDIEGFVRIPIDNKNTLLKNKLTNIGSLVSVYINIKK